MWRVPLHADAGEVHLSRPRVWWPHQDKAVSVGILVCLTLTAFTLIPIDSAAMPVREFLRVLRSALVEAAACALVLSAIYYFFFGYLARLRLRRIGKTTRRSALTPVGSLIIASALEAGCDTLLTEGLQTGRRIEGLTIVNPFA